MNLKSILPIVVLGGLAWALSRLWSGPSVEPTSPVNELPGYTFPEPGVVGEVVNAQGEVVAENWIVGTATQAWENAQAVLAVKPKTITGIPYSYRDVQEFDLNIGQIPAGLGGEMVNYDYQQGEDYLDISTGGWAVYRRDFSTLNPTGWALKRGSTAFMGLFHELPEWLT